MIANLIGRVLALVSVAVAFGASAKTYEANWESLNTRPCPEWWKNAKFGIFVHWGTYSVPAFAPYDKNSVYGCYAEHYGNPQHQEKYPAIPTFHAKHYPNKSYIDFAAEFTAENFDPAAWAELFKRSGMVSACSIQREIDEAAERGGGRVVVPAGEHFIDGPLHLRSNVELHLEDGAMLVFTDNPAKYLPAVPSSWEGLECLNYSPLVYAYCCTNVAITGKGTLAPKMDRWAAQMERERQTWTSPEKDPRYDIQAARAILYKWGSEDYPVEKRDMTKAHPAVMRPQLVQFNRCKGVRVEDVRIRDCPFWTIHLFLSEDVVVRGVDSRARGFNNDGIDIEMSRNILVENCRFDQGDDGIVLKAGRNRDAWRLNRPTENIVVRNCDFAFAHSLLGIGSELSGGICNVWMHHCKIGSAYNLFYVKTNRRRGGFVKNINFGDVECDNIRGALCRVETDVLYQWAKFPDYELRRTEIDGLHIRNVKANCADYAIDIRGDAAAPVRNVELENVWLGSFRKAFERVENATDICKENVRCGGLEPKSWDQPVSVNAKGKSK